MLALLWGNASLFAQKELHYRKIQELDSLANIAQSKGNSDKVILAAKEAMDYAQKNLGESDSICLLTRLNYANAFIMAGAYDKAEKELNEFGKSIKKLFQNSQLYAYYLGLQGKNYFYAGKHELSENYYLKQINLLKKIAKNDGLDYAEAMNNLGVLYAELRRFEEAEPLYILSKDIRKSKLGEQNAAYGQSLNNLAVLYKNLKRYNEAESLYLENLKIQKKLSERSYALSLNNLAIYYSVTAQEKKALPLLLEAADIRRRILGEEHPDYARIMHNLGEAYSFFKDYKSSEKHFLKAIEIRERLFEPQHPDLLESYSSLAFTYLYSGDSSNMWKYIQKSFENNGFKANFPSTFDDKFRSKMEKTEFLNLSRAISCLSPVYKYYSLQILSDPNNIELKKEALNICKTVLFLEDKYRLSFAAENDKLRSASELIRWNKHTMALSFDLAKQQSSALNDVFLVAERNKSIILLNTLKAQKARSFGDLPDSLIQKENSLQKELSQIEKQLIETKDEAKKTALLEKKNNLRTASQTFTKVLEEKYPKYYKLKYAASNSELSKLQQRLPENSLMIEYYFADSLLYIFSLSKTEIKVLREEINPELLKKQIQRLRRCLSDYDYIKNQPKASEIEYKESASWFYEKLLSKTLIANKKTNNLIIIPDAELGHLPFEVFLTEKTTLSDYAKMPYLLNRYKISYNYSAALWLENQSHTKKKNNAKVFAAASLYSSKSDSLRAPVNRETNLLKIRKQFQDLPMARAEVTALEKLFKGKFLVGTAASEAEFKKNASEYAVIHLAMHGLLNTQYPILSSLAFTENSDSVEDNFLQAYEISNMNLNAQMVVLSACETGYGRFQQGEGVMSLARSFMYAGVPSLVVSLWQVNDVSTAKIMQLFYKNLASGMDKAEALRQAKISYFKDNKEVTGLMAHPVFWAAFVQLGDSCPIKLEQKLAYSTIIWISIGIAAALILSVFIFLRKRRH